MLKKYLIFSVFISILFFSCEKEQNFEKPLLSLKTDFDFIADNSEVPIGGKIKIGFTVESKNSYISNIRINRIINEEISNQLDAGIWISAKIDTFFLFTKGSATKETWEILILNSNRDSAKISFIVNLGAGSGYGEINYFPSILLSYPQNSEYSHFLDFETGTTYNSDNISGFEATVDMCAFFYVTSGKNSPTITCPGYSSVPTYYPEVLNWATRNSTNYDYRSTDYNLVSITDFDNAQNDSLLITAFQPNYVSGLDKFCYTGKVIPFKNSNGKYGIIKVIRADETENGTMEIAVKIQK